MKPRAITVLGMHRSGTSALTGCLKDAGVWLGSVAERSRYNAKGNQENPAIWRLHDALLDHAGGSWFAPPGRVEWNDHFRARRDEIIAEYRGKESWGFKDPRTLLTLDGWLEALPDLRMIASVRNPVAVARSLEARETFRIPYRDGIELWRVYNERLLRWSDSRLFPIVSFDLPGDEYQRSVHRALIAIGLQPPSKIMFFDADLQHQPKAPSEEEWAALPESVRWLHRELVERARAG
jgi:hypothetical protein